MLEHGLKRTLPALMLLGVLLLAACGSEPQPGVVEVWATWASMPEETMALFERYSRESGVQVRVKTGLKGDRLADRLAGSTPPDLLILSTNDPVAGLFEDGLIAPLAGQAALAPVDLDDLFPAAQAQCASAAGRLLCLPWGSDVQVLYWNKALFQAAGLDPDRPPQSMEEVLEMAKMLTRRDAAGELVQVGFIPDFYGSHSELFAHLLGAASPGGDSATPVADAAALQAALAWQQRFFDFYDPGLLEAFVSSFTPYRTSSHPVFAGARLGCQGCHRDAPLERKKGPAAGFLDGRIAMMVDGGWLASPPVRALAQSRLEFGVAPFPAAAAAPGRAGASPVQGPVLVMPAAAVDKEAAGQLLAWLARPENQAEAALHNGLLPSSRAAAQDPAFQQYPEQAVLLDLLAGPNAIHHPSTPQGPARNALVSEAEDVVFHTGANPAAILSQLPDFPQ